MAEIKNHAAKTFNPFDFPRCFPSNFPRTGDWESSSVEPITWGKPVKTNHEEDLQRWNDLPKDRQVNEEEQPTNTHTQASISNTADNTATSDSEEYKKDPWYYNSDETATHQRVETSSIAHEGRDDEQEFTRTPIAGEDSEDYNSSNDYESNSSETKLTFKNNTTRITEPLTTLPVV